MPHTVTRKLLPSRREVQIIVNGGVAFTANDPGVSSLVAYLNVARGVLTDDVLYKEEYPTDMIRDNEVPADRLQPHLFKHGTAIESDWFEKQIALILKSPLDPPGSEPSASAEDFVGASAEGTEKPKKAKGKKPVAEGAPEAGAAPVKPSAGSIPSTCSWPADPILGRASGGDMAVVEICLPREIDYRDPRNVSEWCKRRGYRPLSVQFSTLEGVGYWRAVLVEPSQRPPGVVETIALARSIRVSILRIPSAVIPSAVAHADLDRV